MSNSEDDIKCEFCDEYSDDLRICDGCEFHMCESCFGYDTIEEAEETGDYSNWYCRACKDVMKNY